MTAKSGLTLLFGAIFTTLLAWTTWATMHQSVTAWGGLTTPPDHYWTIATLLDAYFGFVTFYVWVAFKERRWLPRDRLVRRDHAVGQHGDVRVCVDPTLAVAVTATGVEHFECSQRMKDFVRRRLLDPLLALLKQGIAPERLALCVAIGITVGLVPVLGVSTLLCTVIALAFRLNLPAIQLTQAVMAPLQLLLIVPFVRLGEWMMHAAPQPVSVSAGLALMKQGIWHAVIVLKDAILHASVAWIAVAPVAVYTLYRILRPIFSRAAAAMPGVQSSVSTPTKTF